MVKLTRGSKASVDFSDMPNTILPLRIESTDGFIEVETNDPAIESYFRTKAFT